jgi:solute carrier family 13 (sodium-dependent dicarboxylate transporter), member 2/3/5
MVLQKKAFQIAVAVAIGVTVMMLPRPEGNRFKISGENVHGLLEALDDHFTFTEVGKSEFVLEAKHPGSPESTHAFITNQASRLNIDEIRIDYVDGLSPKGMRFLSVLAVLIFLFIFEPVPLEISAILIGVFLIFMGIGDVREVWAPYMHPVVVFIMCCLIFAIALEKTGITRRMGYWIAKRAGTSVVKFTFLIAIGLGWASSIMHDAVACAIGIVTMLPMIRAAGIEPNTNTARFMMLSLPFACSVGGMGTLAGSGRNMVAMAFLREFTGIEITFSEWILYALPVTVLLVPLAVLIVYFVFRPNTRYQLPVFDEDSGPWTSQEKKTMIVAIIVLLAWLTKGIHGYDYSVTGMLGVAALVLLNVLGWEDVNDNLEWGTALFIFGGGISLGLAMDYSGAAAYFANLIFPLFEGGGWLLLFAGVGLFCALITNAMANVAATALILPIVIPIAQFEGVNPVVMAMCLGMATSFAFLLVIACPPNAIAYSYHHFKSSDLTKAGMVATPVLLAGLILMVSIWWRIIGLV